MVAIIKAGHSMHRIFNYNENKVKEGVAECIGAENFPLNADEMSLKIKLGCLLKRIGLNENVKRNSVHISLNFDPSEAYLTKERLMEIAGVYMNKLGFGEQPYLVYQHHDTGHPHIHIVTTNIEADGKRIDLHHLGIRKSEPARKAIEKDFGLVAAEAQKKQEALQLKPVPASKVAYGKSQTKMAIQNVLEAVINKYSYTSLAELNAVLNQYNVTVERGKEESKLYQAGGLLYRVLDAAGNPIGVPIKASLFHNKPTLKFLEERFKSNEVKCLSYKARIKNAIDKVLLGENVTLQQLLEGLKREGIHTALRISDTGIVYGITYVDHHTKSVFNGSALGKQYSAKAIQERCNTAEVSQQGGLAKAVQLPTELPPKAIKSHNETPDRPTYPEPVGAFSESETILDALLMPEQVMDYVPGQLKKSKRKRKRKNLNNNQ